MGDITTLSVEASTAETFKNEYRHPDHHSTDEALQSLMAIVPPYDGLECTMCGDGPMHDAPYDETNGIIEFFTIAEEQGGGFEALFFCSKTCYDDLLEKQDLWNPDEPDAFIIGGVNESRVRIEEPIWFDRDGLDTFIGIDLPGVFEGDRVGGAYDYTGEPLYVEYRDRIIESGVVVDITHEEWSTYVSIDEDESGIARFYHPDEDKREDFRGRHTIWYDVECPECETVNRTHEGQDGAVTCRECEAEFDRPAVPEERRSLFYDDDGEPRDILVV